MPPKKKVAPKNPLRDALNRKRVTRTYYDMPIAGTEEIDAARTALDRAGQVAVATLMSDDEDIRSRGDAALAEAREGLAECFHRIWFRPIGLSEFDALTSEHPPTTAQRKEGHPWNPDTFIFALLAVSAEDSDLSEEEWAAELADEKKWPAPDRNGIYNAALRAQRQSAADPKG
jgi:hypothetical protein